MERGCSVPWSDVHIISTRACTSLSDADGSYCFTRSSVPACNCRVRGNEQTREYKRLWPWINEIMPVSPGNVTEVIQESTQPCASFTDPALACIPSDISSVDMLFLTSPSFTLLRLQSEQGIMLRAWCECCQIVCYSCSQSQRT